VPLISGHFGYKVAYYYTLFVQDVGCTVFAVAAAVAAAVCENDVASVAVVANVGFAAAAAAAAGPFVVVVANTELAAFYEAVAAAVEGMIDVIWSSHPVYDLKAGLFLFSLQQD
jgi:hypothetical protein